MITDANVDCFWAAYSEGVRVQSRDMLAEYPAVAAQVAYGAFEVHVVRMEWEGRTVYVAHADDGFDGRDPEDENDFLTICATEAEAKVVAHGYVADWKRAWRVY